MITVSGSGSTQRTPSFTVEGQWDLEWEYSCPGGSTQFTVNVHDDRSGGETSNPPLVVQSPGAGVTRFPHGGTLFLRIGTTSCSWRVRVVDVPESAATGGPATTGQAPSRPPDSLPVTGRDLVALALLGAVALVLGGWALNRGMWSKPVSRP